MNLRWQEYDSQNVSLQSGDIHVWRIWQPNFSSLPNDLLTGMVSSDEALRSKKFSNTETARRYLVSRFFLRKILSSYLALEPLDMVINYTDRGKPFIINTKSSLHFNLSHSGDVVLLAISKDFSVGIDVEKERLSIRAADLIERYFSESEKNQLKHVNVKDIRSVFYQAWVKKEAFVKAVGEGLSFPLSGFSVDLLDQENERVVIHNGKANQYVWKVQPLLLADLGGEYHAAVSYQGTLNHLICWDLTSFDE